jgi:activator of 2-hydroxyglutaryl-CoA dehydratase
MGELSLQAKKALNISSTCTVFAESEVISLLTEGHSVKDILAGLHLSISKRVVGLVERIGIAERVAMTGGVAKNIGVVKAIESLLGITLIIPEEPQIVGALGAALVAAEKYQALLKTSSIN